MLLRLDPALPVVWRSPETLQVGVEPPRVVLEHVTALQERVIAALVSGAPRAVVVRIAAQGGLDEAATDELLRRLAPALLPDAPTAPPPAAVAIDTDDPASDRIAVALVEAGLTIEAARPGSALVVLVGRFVIEPSRYRPWMSTDTPHLPVVFGERGIEIGPVVLPGDTPCLYCADLARADADPAWPVIASQLAGRTAPTGTRLGVLLAAAAVAGLACAHTASGFTPLGAHTLVIEPETGAVHRRRNHWHPDCGCRALPGSGWANEGLAAALPSPRS